MNPILFGIILAGNFDNLFKANYRQAEKRLYGFNDAEYIKVEDLQATVHGF